MEGTEWISDMQPLPDRGSSADANHAAGQMFSVLERWKGGEHVDLINLGSILALGAIHLDSW